MICIDFSLRWAHRVGEQAYHLAKCVTEFLCLDRIGEQTFILLKFLLGGNTYIRKYYALVARSKLRTSLY